MLWISITAVTDAIASALFDAGHVVISGGAPIVIDDVSSVYQYMHIRMGC
jgi:organic radical activating enzyme